VRGGIIFRGASRGAAFSPFRVEVGETHCGLWSVLAGMGSECLSRTWKVCGSRRDNANRRRCGVEVKDGQKACFDG